MAVDGTTLTMYGRRDVFYEFVPGVVVRISFLVCDAKFPILAVRELHDRHGIGVHFDSRGGFRLELPGIDESIPFEADSGIYSFTPFRRIPYSEVADFVQRIYKKMSIPIAPVGAPGAGRTDYWRPIGHGSEFIRIHKRLRRRLFAPDVGVATQDIPIPKDRLRATRTTIMEFTDGATKTLVDDWTGPDSTRIPDHEELGPGVDPNLHWTGETRFQIIDRHRPAIRLRTKTSDFETPRL